MSGTDPVPVPAVPAVPAVPGAPAAPPGDVIHDIGFRHYDGPRLGRGWILRSLLVETVRGVFGLGRPARAKITPWVLIAILLIPPAVIALSVLVTGSKDLPLSYTQYLTFMQLVILLFVAGAAPNCVSRDLRHGVMPLYLSRPMHRSDYVLAKLAGLALSLFAVLAAAQTLLLIGALLARLPAGHQLLGWAGGLLTVALLSVLLSAITVLIASVTPRRGLAVAAIVTGLLVVSGVVLMLTAIADEKGYATAASYLPALSPFSLVDGLAVGLLGVAPADGASYPSGALGVVAFGSFLVATVGACVALLVRRYRKVGGV